MQLLRKLCSEVFNEWCI